MKPLIKLANYTIAGGILTDKPTPTPPTFIAGESNCAINLTAGEGGYSRFHDNLLESGCIYMLLNFQFKFSR
ncbi:hypothetical protein [Nostoc sp.]|uniref:hypothetical protein n=1 Tax=Nostoc sp. TaxID=1180 RepID=UPI002FFC9C09